MRIGFNFFTGDAGYRGGVNTYAIGLLTGFLNVIDNHSSIKLFVNEGNVDNFKTLFANRNVEFIIIRKGRLGKLKIILLNATLLFGSQNFYKYVNDFLWRSCIKTINQSSDIVYTPTATMGLYSINKPTILSMHDIQHVHYPYFFSFLQRLSRRLRYPLSAKSASYIQASSRFIAQDFLNHFSFLNSQQVIVINEGVFVEQFSKKSLRNMKLQYKLPDEYLFFPAQLWLHKNHITVLKALDYLKTEKGIDIPIVLTGALGSGASQIFEFIRIRNMTNVHYLGKVPFADLVALYQQAKLFITAVLYESSSLPFLEAAASGCPIIASDTAPNRELTESLKATLFDPLDYVQLSEKIEVIWSDSALRGAHVKHNKKAVCAFDWDNVARKYISFFKEITSASTTSSTSKISCGV